MRRPRYLVQSLILCLVASVMMEHGPSTMKNYCGRVLSVDRVSIGMSRESVLRALAISGEPMCTPDGLAIEANGTWVGFTPSSGCRCVVGRRSLEMDGEAVAFQGNEYSVLRAISCDLVCNPLRDGLSISLPGYDLQVACDSRGRIVSFALGQTPLCVSTASLICQ